MARIVSNSTPLIVLGNIGQLELLKELYGEIYIPEAVLAEVTEKADSACHIIKEADWIHVCKIKTERDYRIYRAKLHAGEVETMILAQEEPKADIVLIDDNAAKKTAKFLGLKVIGSLGILVKAKQSGLIPDIKPIIQKLLENGFYVSDEIIRIVLKAAGEENNA